jgi:tetratricopeptide (TPR) repeat protein
MKPVKTFILAAACFSLTFCATAQKKPKVDPEKDPQYQYEKAVIAMKYGLPEQAIDYVNLALSLDPRHYKSLDLLGLIHLQAKDYRQAADALEKCLEIKPDFIDAINRLGTCHYELGEKDKAEREFQKSVAVDGNAFASFNLAKLRLEENKLQDALNYIDQSILKADSQAGAYNLKGVILNQMERYPEAITSFQTALAITPNDVNVNVNLGIALMNARQYDKSLEVLEKALPNIKDQVLRNKVNEYIKALKEAKEGPPAATWSVFAPAMRRCRFPGFYV